MSKRIGIIKHFRNNLPHSVLLTLYFSLVHPYFKYCNIVWRICRSAVFNISLYSCRKKNNSLLIPNGILILLLCFTTHSAKSYIIWATFLLQKVSVYLQLLLRMRSESYRIRWNNAKYDYYVVQGHSRSRSLIPMESLLVINTNLPPNLHRFLDIAFDRSKIAISGYSLAFNPRRRIGSP